VANVFKQGVKIGHIGQRIDFFWTTIINESELLEKFNIEVLPIDMVFFLDYVQQRAEKNADAYLKEAKEFRKTTGELIDITDKNLVNMFALRDQYKAVYEDNGLDGLAVQSFSSIGHALKTGTSIATCQLGNEYSYACESDIHGAISNLILERAAFNIEGSYLADVTVRHPEDDNGVLMWHGSAPLSMKHEDEEITMDYPWILKGKRSGATRFELKEGPITVTRFDGDHSKYKLAIGEGHSMEGPKTKEQYVWMKVKDWSKWERKLMQGPFIHHMAMQYGNYAEALSEACRFIPGLEPVLLDE
jgi:L-fucose isomerase-like protein